MARCVGSCFTLAAGGLSPPGELWRVPTFCFFLEAGFPPPLATLSQVKLPSLESYASGIAWHQGNFMQLTGHFTSGHGHREEAFSLTVLLGPAWGGRLHTALFMAVWVEVPKNLREQFHSRQQGSFQVCSSRGWIGLG